MTDLSHIKPDYTEAPIPYVGNFVYPLYSFFHIDNDVDGLESIYRNYHWYEGAQDAAQKIEWLRKFLPADHHITTVSILQSERDTDTMPDGTIEQVKKVYGDRVPYFHIVTAHFMDECDFMYFLTEQGTLD